MRSRLRARWVFPVVGPPIENGVVTIRGERIESVGHATATVADAIDLGNAAILPGLVNAHTHLEFSSLAEPLGDPAMPMADWIRRLVAYRRSRTDAERNQAIITGLAECRRSGTTSIGEIATGALSAIAELPGAECPANLSVFLELLGLAPGRIDANLQAAAVHLGQQPTSSVRLGLSPHAPYTVHPELLRRAVALSQSQHVPLAMHVAESCEEIELLATGSGPLRAMLEEFGAWSADAIPVESRPLDYLQRLAEADRALLIHGNYLDAEEIDFIAARRRRMSIVYCPRTHHRFGHDAYPLAKMLAADALVALGTDSRASNPDLDLLAEMRHVAEHHAVAPSRIVEMGTINGAMALGVADEVGSLEPGKFADLAIVRLPDAARNDPYESLFDLRSTVVSTYHRGQPLGERTRY